MFCSHRRTPGLFPSRVGRLLSCPHIRPLFCQRSNTLHRLLRCSLQQSRRPPVECSCPVTPSTRLWRRFAGLHSPSRPPETPFDLHRRSPHPHRTSTAPPIRTPSCCIRAPSSTHHGERQHFLQRRRRPLPRRQEDRRGLLRRHLRGHQPAQPAAGCHQVRAAQERRAPAAR